MKSLPIRNVWSVVRTYSMPVLSGILAVCMLILAVSDTSWIERYKQFNILLLIIQGPLLLGVIKLGNWLINSNPVMRKGLGFNVNLIGFDLKYIGLIVSPLVLTQLPAIAFFEEYYFRYGHVTFVDALLWNILFGLLHFIAGIRLGWALIASGMGMFYSVIYWYFGFDMAVQAHFQYDFLAVCSMIGIAFNKTFPDTTRQVANAFKLSRGDNDD